MNHHQVMDRRSQKKQAIDRSLLLPPDLIYEVLLRLRVKTLTKFQSVCKSWRTLISDHRFRESHHNRSKSTPPVLLGFSRPKLRPNNTIASYRFSSFDLEGNLLKQFDKKLPMSYYQVTFTCLEYVCLWIPDGSTVFLCNPSTEEFLTLPEKPNLVNVGFGYVPCTKEFKVVRVFLSFDVDADIDLEECYRCEVFTLGTNSWRSVANPPFSICNRLNVAFVDGAIYMMPERHERKIAFFDLYREEWGQLDLPPEIVYWLVYQVRLRELRGYLCMAVSDVIGGGPQEHMDLWILKKKKDQQGEWVKEYSIDFSTLLDLKAKNWTVSAAAPLTIDDDGSLLLGMLEYKPGSKPTCQLFRVSNWWRNSQS